MRQACYVYVVGREEGPVKIGITTNLGSRVSAIQTGCPFRVALIHYRKCRDVSHARRHEQIIHGVYAEKRLVGEWFDIEADLAVEAIDTSLDVEGHMEERDRKESLAVLEALRGAH